MSDAIERLEAAARLVEALQVGQRIETNTRIIERTE